MACALLLMAPPDRVNNGENTGQKARNRHILAMNCWNMVACRQNRQHYLRIRFEHPGE